MNSENLMQKNREYYEIAAERIYEELPEKLVKIVRAEQRMAENGDGIFVIEAVIDGRELRHIGDNAFKTIDNLVAEARAGKPISEVVEAIRSAYCPKF